MFVVEGRNNGHRKVRADERAPAHQFVFFAKLEESFEDGHLYRSRRVQDLLHWA